MLQPVRMMWVQVILHTNFQVSPPLCSISGYCHYISLSSSLSLAKTSWVITGWVDVCEDGGRTDPKNKEQNWKKDSMKNTSMPITGKSTEMTAPSLILLFIYVKTLHLLVGRSFWRAQVLLILLFAVQPGPVIGHSRLLRTHRCNKWRCGRSCRRGRWSNTSIHGDEVRVHVIIHEVIRRGRRWVCSEENRESKHFKRFT